MRLALASLLFALVLATPALAAPARCPQAGLLVRGAYVVDPESSAPLRPLDVLVTGSKIVRVGPRLRAPRCVQVIEAQGRYLTPGLWDMHAHLAAINAIGNKPEGYVGHGVLGVRDMGGHLDQLLALRAELRAGRIGPELLIAGPTLNGQAFASFQRAVTTPDEGRQAVRELQAAGVDLIKVHRATRRDVFMAILDEARRQRLPVAGHVPLELKWAEGAAAGMASIEHIQTIVENEVTDLRSFAQIQEAVLRIEGPYGDQIWRSLVAGEVPLDPTVVFYKRSIDTAEPRLQAPRRLLLGRLQGMVKRASDGGVTLIVGTDLVERPGSYVAEELELLVASGLTPAQALRAGTSNSARAAGRPELARIAPKATASFLLLGGDPTRDVSAFRRIEGVALRGRWIGPAELERLRAMDR